MYSYGCSARIGVGGKRGHGGRYGPPQKRLDPNSAPPPLKECDCLVEVDLPEYASALPDGSSRQHLSFVGRREGMDRCHTTLRRDFQGHLMIPGRKQAGPVTIVAPTYRQAMPAVAYFVHSLVSTPTTNVYGRIHINVKHSNLHSWSARTLAVFILVMVLVYCDTALARKAADARTTGASRDSRKTGLSPLAFIKRKSKLSSSSSSSSSSNSAQLEWKEDLTAFDHEKPSFLTILEEERRQEQLKATHRKIVWMGSMQYDSRGSPLFSSSNTSNDKSSFSPLSWWKSLQLWRRPETPLTKGTMTPHALRTAQWNMTMSWREHRRHRSATLTVDFDDNGYVRVHPQNDPAGNLNSWYAVGTWTLDTAGVRWKIPARQWWKHIAGNNRVTELLDDDDDDNDEDQDNDEEVSLRYSDNKQTPLYYHFYADLHLNPFGSQPKMLRGFVLRDRAGPTRWFRPIVATFTGRGVGVDTADFSYKERTFHGTTATKSQTDSTASSN